MRQKLLNMINIIFYLLVFGTVICGLYFIGFAFSDTNPDNNAIYALGILILPFYAAHIFGSEVLIWRSVAYWVTYPGCRPVELTASILQVLVSAAVFYGIVHNAMDIYLVCGFAVQCLCLCTFWIARWVTNRRQAATTESKSYDTKKRLLHTIFITMFVLTFLTLLVNIGWMHQSIEKLMDRLGRGAVWSFIKAALMFFGFHLFLREFFLYQGITILVSSPRHGKLVLIAGILQSVVSIGAIVYAFCGSWRMIDIAHWKYAILMYSLAFQYFCQCTIWIGKWTAKRKQSVKG